MAPALLANNNNCIDVSGSFVKQEMSNWYLFGVSAPAKKGPCIQLKIGDNKVGKSSEVNSVVVPSTLCSRTHCNLVASDHEVILRDEVSH